MDCPRVCAVLLSCSVVSDSVRPRGMCVACQAPLSMGFSRQEYWSGLSCPPPGDLPNPWIKPRSSALQVDSLLAELTCSLLLFHISRNFHYGDVPRLFKSRKSRVSSIRRWKYKFPASRSCLIVEHLLLLLLFLKFSPKILVFTFDFG